MRPRCYRLLCLLPLVFMSGCTLLTIADAVGTVAVGTVGLAAGAVIGTVKIVGNGVGKAADAMTDDKAKDAATAAKPADGTVSPSTSSVKANPPK